MLDRIVRVFPHPSSLTDEHATVAASGVVILRLPVSYRRIHA
jgi:hypothetical protein